MAEFLPLCDVLFNVVSLAGYFCDVVFDLVMVYTLYECGLSLQFGLCLSFIVFSTLLSNFLSIRWYLQRSSSSKWTRGSVILLHMFQLGVLWRYAGLFIPVQLSRVKRDVRDLCILRLIHAFIEASPMLLLQLQLLPPGTGRPPADLTTVSCVLSLFSVCWALASFSKNVRLQKVDGLVLTWLGVISQFLWRGGTVSARFLALGAYTALYGPWILLVLGLHWMCMLLWLLSLRGERALSVSALLAAVYVVAYVNLQERPHRRRMAVFYVVMALENGLLLAAWLAGGWHNRPEHWLLLPLLAGCLFTAGLFFMLLYYRYFHVRRLNWDKPSAPPGVFNCRFVNPACAATTANKRKKKKPTSFVPPPTLQNNLGPMAVPFWRRPLPSSSENEGSSVGSRVNIHQKLQEKKQKQLAELKIIEEEIKQGKLGGPAGGDADDPTRQPIPRVKKHVEPLCWPPRPDLANNTSGNLHKLTNYKQSLGELAGLSSLGALNNLASYLHTRLNTPLSPILGSDSGSVPRQRPRPPLVPPPRTKQRSRTPEILLSPHFLYCDWAAPPCDPAVTGNGVNSGQQQQQQQTTASPGSDTENQADNRVPSDIDSQVSLPRSYTLPREFKYYRRPRTKRRPEHFVASTNSSDGDVDSADNESDSSPHLCPAAHALVKRRPYHSQVKHETKL